jgi:cytochrome c oxidase assembly factor CtaG
VLVHPLVAVILFNVIVAGTHMPSVVDGLMPKQGGAFLIDAAWLLGGLVFWWPVIMPVPVYERFGDPMKILYVLIGTLFHTVIGMVMLSAELPMYGIYELAPPIIAVPVRADQQLAGGIMELGVFGVIVLASAILFFRWAGRDGKAAH